MICHGLFQTDSKDRHGHFKNDQLSMRSSKIILLSSSLLSQLSEFWLCLQLVSEGVLL